MKKGQIAIFVVVVILIVVSLAILVLAKNRTAETQKGVSSEVRPIYSFVENCIKETGLEAVNYIGQTGGYFEISTLSTDEGIAYYLYEDENYMPFKETIENEIASYVDTLLYFCVGNFEDFEDYNVT